MRWTKRKQLIEDFIYDPLKNRISINRIVYRKSHDEEARMTITFDKQEIFTADNIQFALKSFELEKQGVGKEYQPFNCDDKKIDLFEKTIRDAAEAEGKYAVYHLEDFFDYFLLSVEEALQHSHVLIRAFAMLDKRLGKRRFSTLDISNEHKLVQQFYEIRKQSWESNA
ncbi:hypothetical protein [Macrococcoides bohemicum]|uniref:SF0329 family protein n=1 Tax=Macrococcoides bohemicum TaxID=1903056 RepID=UPI00165E94E9|nr:hypothetical protein [Macrococcus bohemicus]MBC9874022.1 hypothetical protein [Macrococcus bohemicus]